MDKKINIIINSKKYIATSGQTILDVCLAHNIFIPTLCKHPDLSIQGKCRVCLVEIIGHGLVTSCSTPVEENMEVITNSTDVIRARGINLEMIYAEHIEKCGNCIQESNCTLKSFAEEYNLDIARFKDRKKNYPIWNFGKQSPQVLADKIKYIKQHYPESDYELRINQARLHTDGYIQFDSSKCIDCGICTEVCQVKQTCDFYETTGKASKTQTKPTDNLTKDCANCGQCVVHCPVGAIQGVPHWQQVETLLKNKKDKIIVAQIAPSIRVSIGEEFGMDYGDIVTGQLAASMRALGFDAVFDVTVGADFTTYEEAYELVQWLTSKKDKPMFTSCCPGWVKFLEFNYPEMVSHLTTSRSPQMHSAILAKTYWAQQIKQHPKDIIVVSIMPCTAKKQEITLARHQFRTNFKNKKLNLPIVDYVLTTREYAYLLKRHHIDFNNIKSEEMDNPLGVSSGAGVIYGASGGVMESALRTADYFLRVKQETGSLQSVLHGADYKLQHNKYSKIAQTRINFKEVRGQQGVKSAVVKVGGINLKVAIVNELGNARQLIEDIKHKKCYYDYVEVMACPGGCIGGGGQPVPVSAKIREQRAQALYDIDTQQKVRAAHENPAVLATYRDFFAGDQEKIEELMHCNYYPREPREGYRKID